MDLHFEISPEFVNHSVPLGYLFQHTTVWDQARAEGGGALGAQGPALFQNYSKEPLSDKYQ